MATQLTRSPSPSLPARFLTKKEVCLMLGLSRATVERMTAIGMLPLPIQVGKRAVRWDAAEIAGCISNMPRVEDAYACHVTGRGGAP
ncbi:Phage transcriptional regulator AlpA (modular protein) [uncultured delta proteobacterium]|uniref:Phage transcriptional regulator AlpA (Modular protein) n=1 Tax=uncultured delta proteobacterium TaxID=34034 RepID=A0A212JXG9_9DELT|nr:Phage transcriptional regulator AlpA (modular protein) [uncultured delta proteobacterium]